MKTKKTQLQFEKSAQWLDRSLRAIPSGTQTFSKGHTQYPRGASPLFLEKGEGAYVYDVDGNKYIDYPLALGPNILGYGNTAVDNAVIHQIRQGVSFSLPHRLEVEVAEMLIDAIPCAEMVRFGKNGSDVTSAAIRLARAVTGRDEIACCGYHGWQDWYIATTTRDLGIPKEVKKLSHTFEYNDLASLETLLQSREGKFAAVILEPMGVIDPAPGFLEGVRALAHTHGAILIFDEIVTGFRLATGGAQELFNVTPDLACFGKAMANGFPLSALVGKREIMERVDDIFFSFTAGGEAVSLAACKATLQEISRLDLYPKLWKLGDKLRDGFNAASEKQGLSTIARCIGPGPHTVVPFKNKEGEDSLFLRSLFQQEAVARGVLFLVGHNICAALEETDVAKTLEAYEEIFDVLKRAIDSDEPEKFLKGKQAQPVFRKP